MRQRHKPWADEFLSANRHIVIPKPCIHKNKWQSVFCNSNPVHVEIGTGKGQFIVGMAKQYPCRNFIGIELAKSIVASAAQKVKDSECENIRLLNENAIHVQDIFGAGEVTTVYLNFSDPWPKNRHEKRRLTYHTFLQQYRDILTSDGDVILKTDNRGLFEYSLDSFVEFGLQLEEVYLDLHSKRVPTNIMTEYEQKFSEKGQPIYMCRATFV